MYVEVLKTEYGVVGTYYRKDEKGNFTIPDGHELAMLDSAGQNRRGYFTSNKVGQLVRALTISTVIKRAHKVAN